MGYTSTHTYGVKTTAQMLAITGQQVGDTVFNTNTYKQHIWNGYFWMNSDMIMLLNTSGGDLIEGDVVKTNGDRTVTKTTTSAINFVGVVVYSGTNNNYVAIAIKGGPYKVKNTTSTSLGYFLYPYATGLAQDSATIPGTGSQAFGQAIEAIGAAGLCNALLWAKIEVH